MTRFFKDDTVLAVQDAYLRERIRENGGHRAFGYFGDPGRSVHLASATSIIDSGAFCFLFDPSVHWQAVCIHKMKEVFESQERQEAEEIVTVTSLLGFWNKLYHHGRLQSDSVEQKTNRTNQARLQIMMQYILS